MPQTSRPRRLLALATDNWPARTYLTVVGVSVAAMFVAPESPVAAGPLVLTAPLSLLSVVLPFGPGTEGPLQALAFGSWTVWLLLCALVNAAVLGALAKRSTPTTTTAPPTRAGARPYARTRARLRTLLAPAVDNWPARAYLAVVATSLVFFLCADHVLTDPAFAAIWPLMATAPAGFLAFLLPTSNPLAFAAATALCGLANAVLLGHLAHRLRAPEAHPAT
ncbi:SCO4225 family membrane protein [Streptomyces sp. NPDC050528]|uniref:SCO4225 family membrane protein n=1 Tax=unclassified Streptomyces TaxID=2593676 RepID=UPI00379EEE82